MYCLKCYTDLAAAADGRCPRCGRGFDPAKPGTYAAWPFPPPAAVVVQLVATTVLAAAAAFVVAIHQAARASGH